MSGERPPFGFSAGDSDPDDSKPNDDSNLTPGGANPFGFLGGLGGFGGAGGPGGFGQGMGADGGGEFDMNALGAALQQLGAMLQSGGGDLTSLFGGAGAGAATAGAVDWDLAKRTARQAVASADGGDPSVSEADRAAVVAALALADLWLDPVTDFPGSGANGEAWSRSEWVEATMPAWQGYIGPVAEGLSTAMSSFVANPAAGFDPSMLPEGLPPEFAEQFAAMTGPMMNMAASLAASMYGGQVGQGLGALAAQVVGAGDVGIPLTPAGRGVLLPRNVAEFGEGLEIPIDEVRLYLALREAAHQRLFASVPWLRPRVEGAVQAYAAGVHVDRERIESQLRDLDPSNPGALQDALSSGVFELEDTPEQRAALTRLETLLALIEGWVDAVVHAAIDARLPNAERLRETVRRRRAIGGPAEKTFATLVGLEMRPRRLRDAAALFESLFSFGGTQARDAVWGHPDLLPTTDDFEDIEGFVRRSAPLDLGVIERELGTDLDGDGAVGAPDPDLSPEPDSE